MEDPSPSTTTSRGRPRDQRVDTAVLAATRELLVELGYTRLGFEAIAQRAGVSRPTLYRRWPTKAHLVHDAVFPQTTPDEGDGPLVPSTGSFERDLRRLIERTLHSYARPEARIAIPGLLTDLDEPSHRASVLDRLQLLTRQQWRQRIARAVADGQVRPDVDPDVLLETIVGALLQRIVVQGDVDPAFASVLVDLLLAGLRPVDGSAPRA